MTFMKCVGVEQRQIRSKIHILQSNRAYYERRYRNFLESDKEGKHADCAICERYRTFLDMRIVALKHLLATKMEQNGLNNRNRIPKFC